MPDPLKRLMLASLAVLFAMPAPAVAATDVRTRVVDCETGSCLLIVGRRADPASTVEVNGHEVPTIGDRNWRASIPLSAVRDWSTPYARSIVVAIDGVTTQVDLPIGLLGISTDLTFLTVRVS